MASTKWCLSSTVICYTTFQSIAKQNAFERMYGNADDIGTQCTAYTEVDALHGYCYPISRQLYCHTFAPSIQIVWLISLKLLSLQSLDNNFPINTTQQYVNNIYQFIQVVNQCNSLMQSIVENRISI